MLYTFWWLKCLTKHLIFIDACRCYTAVFLLPVCKTACDTTNKDYTQCGLLLDCTPGARAYTILLTTRCLTVLWVAALSLAELSSSVSFSKLAELLLSPSSCWFQREDKDSRVEWSSSRADITVWRQGSCRVGAPIPSLERPAISSSTALAEEEIVSLQLLKSFPRRRAPGTDWSTILKSTNTAATELSENNL